MFYIPQGRGRYPREVSPHFGPRPTPSRLLVRGCVLLAALLAAACGGGDASPTPSTSLAPVGIVESPYGRVWLGLPADFPPLAEGRSLDRLDRTDASGALWSALGVKEATTAAVGDLQRLGWKVAEPRLQSGSWEISATRDSGACTMTIVVEPLGSRTSLVVYLGEGCPQP